MDDQSEALRRRVEQFALDILSLLKTLPRDEPALTIRRQLTKSSTSVPANYRAARRSRSHAEFTARIGVVAEEADETLFWLQTITNTTLTVSSELPRLLDEADQLVAIFSAMVATARRNEFQHRHR